MPLSPFFILILILNIFNLNLSTFYSIDLTLSAANILVELNPNMMYDVMKPFNPLLKRFGSVITSEQLGRAMVRVGKDGYAHSIIESSDLKKIGK
ncbi:hypothetical protein CON83_02815 [Bacillus wiedmannii]|nr:hypothetical protein CON83_02815 [Bacillus wiedmannii]PFZ49278.1 hypothetical protein COL58_11315 [Bacillus wiedmannii]HDR7782006.1 hypothetical protein [Bacillus wiedmannii]